MENKPNFGEVLEEMNYLLNIAPQNVFSANYGRFKELYQILEGIILTNKGFSKTL